MGFVGASSFGVFFLSLFVVSSAALFLVLERVSGLFRVHFSVILESDSSPFFSQVAFSKTRVSSTRNHTFSGLGGLDVSTFS